MGVVQIQTTHQARHLLRLRDRRQNANYSIRELAELAGTSPNTIYALEHQHRLPHPHTVRRLARALNTQPADLY